MTNILCGNSVIHWIQSYHTPFLDVFFLSATYLGSSAFYIGAIALLYLCIDKKFAVRIFYLIVIGCLFNGCIKEYFSTPRPPDKETVRVVLGYRAGGGSFPSGHSQGVLAFWGYCFTRFRNFFCILFGSFLICAVSFSRLYLGVHYPIDVLGGLLIGLATIVVFVAWFKFSERIRWRDHTVLALLAIAGIPLVYFCLFPTRENGQLMGTMIGFGTGALLERRYIGFDEKGTFLFQAVKYALGVVSAVLIMCCCAIIPAAPHVRDMVAYAGGSFWIGFGVPYVVRKLKGGMSEKTVTHA